MLKADVQGTILWEIDCVRVKFGIGQSIMCVGGYLCLLSFEINCLKSSFLWFAYITILGYLCCHNADLPVKVALR